MTCDVFAQHTAIAANCFGVSGRASGSDLAAAVMARSSAALGITMDGRLDTLDIALHLTTIGSAQADGPSHLTAFHKCHAVEDRSLRRERESCAARRTRSLSSAADAGLAVAARLTARFGVMDCTTQTGRRRDWHARLIALRVVPDVRGSRPSSESVRDRTVVHRRRLPLPPPCRQRAVHGANLA